MSLIKCPECNHEVSEYEKTCPLCGLDIVEWTDTVSFLDDYLRDVEQVVDYKVENFINDKNPGLHANMINGRFILAVYEECSLESPEYGIKCFLIQNQFLGFSEKDYTSAQGFLLEITTDGNDHFIRLKQEQVLKIKELLPKNDLIKESDLIGYIIDMNALFKCIYKVSFDEEIPWIEERKENGFRNFSLEIPKEFRASAPILAGVGLTNLELISVEYENGFYYLTLENTSRWGDHSPKLVVVYENEIDCLFRGFGLGTAYLSELRSIRSSKKKTEITLGNPYKEALNYCSAKDFADSKKESFESYEEAILFWEKCNLLGAHNDKIAFCKAFMDSFCFFSNEYYSAVSNEEKKIISQKYWKEAETIWTNIRECQGDTVSKGLNQEEQLEAYSEKDYGFWHDRGKVEQYLKESYGDNLAVSNAMLLAFDQGIINEVRNLKIIDNAWIIQKSESLESIYGIKPEIIKTAIIEWVTTICMTGDRKLDINDFDTTCLVDIILSSPDEVEYYYCENYLDETKSYPSAGENDGELFYILWDTVALKKKNTSFFFKTGYIFTTNSEKPQEFYCYFLLDAEQEIKESTYFLTDLQFSKIRNLIKGKKVFYESNIDGYVHRTHKLIAEMAEDIKNNRLRWIDECHDDIHELKLEGGRLLKGRGLFGRDFGDEESNCCLFIFYFDGYYRIHALIPGPEYNSVVRVYNEECLKILFALWGLDDECLEFVKSSRSVLVTADEEYDKEFAVLRRCESKTQFIENSTLYFPNDYQAEECWKQCKDALWCENTDDDEYYYCQDFMNDYYYAQFLERDDYDKAIYREYEDRASRIFQQMHSIEMREWFVKKALDNLTACDSKDEYIEKTSYSMSEAEDTLFFFESEEDAGEFWDLCNYAKKSKKDDFIDEYLKKCFYRKGKDNDEYSDYVDHACLIYEQVRELCEREFD